MTGIDVRQVSKRFRSIQALETVSLTVSPGRCLGLLGPNGAGKTTLVRILSTIFAPDRGTAAVAGFNVVEQGDEVRRVIGVLTEHPNVYPHLNPREYLDFFGGIHKIPPPERRRRIDELLDDFGLAERSRDRLNGFSKGMKQKICLARTLLHQPQVLLLDEPTSGLDPEASRALQETFRALRRRLNLTVVVCSHDLAVVAGLCDDIAIIHHGRILDHRSLSDLPPTRLVAVESGRRPTLEEHYLTVLGTSDGHHRAGAEKRAD